MTGGCMSELEIYKIAFKTIQGFVYECGYDAEQKELFGYVTGILDYAEAMLKRENEGQI